MPLRIEISVEWLSNTAIVSDKTFEPYPFSEDDQDEGLFEKTQSMAHFNSLTLSTNFGVLPRNLIQKTNNHTAKGVIKIVVQDTGCGMSKEQMSKLFQKFSQVTLDPSKRKLGIGLGLFITKQLCQAMDGDIRAYSKVDKGSSFIVCIPIEPKPEIRSSVINLEPEATTTRGNLKVLIVDDEVFNQNILRCFFEKLKIEVLDIAANGKEAYEKYKSLAEAGNLPDIVTMDLEMPIMSGQQASQKIRKLEGERKYDPCLLLVISANCSESEIRECLDPKGQIRANKFMKKPVSIEELKYSTTSYFGEQENVQGQVESPAERNVYKSKSVVITSVCKL